MTTRVLATKREWQGLSQSRLFHAATILHKYLI